MKSSASVTSSTNTLRTPTDLRRRRSLASSRMEAPGVSWTNAERRNSSSSISESTWSIAVDLPVRRSPYSTHTYGPLPRRKPRKSSTRSLRSQRRSSSNSGRNWSPTKTSKVYVCPLVSITRLSSPPRMKCSTHKGGVAYADETKGHGPCPIKDSHLRDSHRSICTEAAPAT